MAAEEPDRPAEEPEAAPAVALDVADDPEAKLTAALAAAQGEFPPIEKKNTAEVRGKEGKASYSYTYADLGDVLASVRPVIAKHGLAITQRTRHLDGGKVLLTTELRHVGGGKLDSEVELGQSPGNPQAFGGALTYLRRYEIVTLLGIAAEEDRDAQDVEPERRGNGREPQLPGWTTAASDQRKKEFLQALEPIIGTPRAKGLAVATVDTFGVFPDLLVGFAKGFAGHYASVQQAGGVEAEKQAAEKAEAERAAQQAEAPDEPSPEPAVATPAPESEPEPAEEPPPGTGELPPDEAEAAKPAPASVPKPEQLKGSKEQKETIMRELGCICTHPLTKDGDNDQCPIEGHGIPF